MLDLQTCWRLNWTARNHDLMSQSERFGAVTFEIVCLFSFLQPPRPLYESNVLVMTAESDRLSLVSPRRAQTVFMAVAAALGIANQTCPSIPHISSIEIAINPDVEFQESCF